MLRMDLPGKWQQGRPKMEVYGCDDRGHGSGLVKEDAEDKTRWRWKVRCDNL